MLAVETYRPRMKRWGWRIVKADAIVCFVKYAWSYQPNAGYDPGANLEEMFSTTLGYTPLGGALASYLGLAAFLIGMALLGYTASRALPWLTGVVAIPIGWAFFASLTTGFAALLSMLPYPQEWGIDPYLSMSMLLHEGMMMGGILLAVSMMLAAALTVQIIRFCVRWLPREKQLAEASA